MKIINIFHNKDIDPRIVKITDIKKIISIIDNQIIIINSLISQWKENKTKNILIYKKASRIETKFFPIDIKEGILPKIKCI